jgi:3-methyladenine DNA glycosylase AlkD
MEYQEVIKKLEALKNPKNIEGMARFGIRPKTKVLGVPIPELRKIAKDIGKDHQLALNLFDSGIHEARILAGFIAEPEKFTEEQVEKWVKTFDSWDVVDQVCSAVLDKTKFAKKKIIEFSKREEEFVKRTAFTLIACLAVHDKKMKDDEFIKFFPLIKKASVDERNFVRKAVNWALRGIGKRNKKLNKEAIKLTKELLKEVTRPRGARLARSSERAAKWIANNALTELNSEAVRKRLADKE